MEIVSGTVPLSARVQKGLKLIEEGRFRKKEVWGEGLSVLNDETAKLPLVKRKALAIRKVLSEMPIEIGEGELLVGIAIQASPQSSTPFPEYATPDEKEAAAKRFIGTQSIFMHYCPYYPKYLKLGLNGLRKIAEKKLNETRQDGSEPVKEAWYEAVIISLDGLKELFFRYRDLASKLADSENNLARKEELQGIARVAQHLLDGPPQTFQEALQAFWFAHIAFHSTHNFVPLGRFDQNLWPYLKRDLDNGTITIQEAQELVDLLWLKIPERLQALEVVAGVSYRDSRRDVTGAIGARGLSWGGKTQMDRVPREDTAYYAAYYNQFLQTVTLGGLTPEGLDGTNPLTYLCVNATFRIQLPQPSMYVRFHKESPPELYERVADCIRAGLSTPSIYNDEVVIPGLEKLGLPLEAAREYTSDGCFEVYPQGRTYFRFATFSIAEALERVLSPTTWEAKAPGIYIEKYDPYKGLKAPDPYTFRSFDEVMELFKKHIDILLKRYTEVVDELWDKLRLYDIAPLPLLSAFVEDPLERGKDITQGGMDYSFHEPLGYGLSHTADSLAVIKKLCFEEKLVEWSELLDAIRDNWQGKESLRLLVKTRAPAYGNDDDYVDNIAKEIVEYFVGRVKRYGALVKNNIKFPTGIATFQNQVHLGKPLGATPDGRLAGEPISSNASPSVGRVLSGQTAAVNSFVKLNHVNLPAGAPLDIAIQPRADLLLQLEAFIKSFLEKGGNLLTIAVTDCETLRAAQREPEKYRDLKLRLGGWEAYFVDLSRTDQDWHIQKFEQYA